MADDELAVQQSGDARDVVLAPPPSEAPPGSMPRAAPLGGGSGSGGGSSGASSSSVLLSRAYGEERLYAQVSCGLCYMCCVIIIIHTTSAAGWFGACIVAYVCIWGACVRSCSCSTASTLQHCHAVNDYVNAVIMKDARGTPAVPEAKHFQNVKNL